MSSCTPLPHRAEGTRIARNLKRSPSGEGFSHLGIDGVYRTFNSRLEVVDYKQLNPQEIQAVLRLHQGAISPELYEAAVQKFVGIDGRDVTDLNSLLHPGPGIAPERPSS